MDDVIGQATQSSIAKSRKSYVRAWKYWILFILVIAQLGVSRIFRVYETQPTLHERLADETDLMRFACWLSPPDGRMKTIGAVASHVSMVRTMHKLATGMDIAEGYKMHRLSYCLKGLGELYPTAPRDRHPATVGMFVAWGATLWWYSRRFCHVAAALELGFQALLRAAELVPRTARAFRADKHLIWRRGRFVPPTGKPRYVEVRITPVKQANKGPNRHAAQLPVVLPMSDAPVCACRALHKLYCMRRSELGGTEPPPDEPVLRDAGGTPLAYVELLRWFRWLIDYLRDAGVDSRTYALHSLRIGGATALLKAGCPPQIIQALGRWSSEIFSLYTRACFHDGLDWADKMARANVVPLEVASLLRRNGIDTEGSESALEREQDEWTEDDADD